MFVPLWLIGLALVLLALLAALAFRRRGGVVSMIDQQRRQAPAVASDQLEVLAAPDLRAAIQAGHKIEAVKLVRERTGLGLREAKELVERHGG